MAGELASVPTWQELTDEQTRRWATVLDHLAGAVPAGAAGVVIDGGASQAGVVADRLADTLRAAGRPCTRLTDPSPLSYPARPTAPAPLSEASPLDDAPPLSDGDAWRAALGTDSVAVADGPHWRRHPPAGGWDVVVHLRTPPGHQDIDGRRDTGTDVVVDLHDPNWPVIRHLADRLAPVEGWYLTESRAFFAARAASWDHRFGDDL
ncbi:hypothetical protein AB0M52_33450, partial [Micromonospora sp. NPDC051296]